VPVNPKIHKKLDTTAYNPSASGLPSGLGIFKNASTYPIAGI
jgi:hypothetical protein